MDIECNDCGNMHEEGDSLNGYCPECVDKFAKQEAEAKVDESMDGDHDSAMTSAGFGTDEDYGGDCEHI